MSNVQEALKMALEALTDVKIEHGIDYRTARDGIKSALLDIEKCEPVYLIISGADYISVSKEKYDEWTSAKRISYTSLRPIEKCESGTSSQPWAELSAQWVIDFIGSNYNSMRTHDEQGNELPIEQIAYSLTVHDLLSAFTYTSPQPRDWVGLDLSEYENHGLGSIAKEICEKLKKLNTKG